MDEWTTGTIKLSINGEPIEMQMTVPATPVKPPRMLPILQAMTNSFVEIGVSKVESEGKMVSCQAGCGACCRQPVPLAEAEVYQLAELVENMPEPRRREIKQKFASAAAHFHENGWFERMDNYANLSPDERRAVVMDYFYAGIPCPFLENESCSIHPHRPLSCREYLVTSPAENCSAPTAETIRQVKMLFKLSDTLRELGRTANMDNLGFVPMIRALEWANQFPENFQEKTGESWLADFFRSLTHSEIPAGENESVSH